VRLLSNHALMAYYDGSDQEMSDSLELAAELTHDPQHMAQFACNARDNHARFELYTDFPEYPRKRIQKGVASRAAMYFVWGLPCDLAEASIKALMAVSRLSDEDASGPIVTGESMEADLGTGKKPDSHARANEKHSESHGQPPKANYSSKQERGKYSHEGRSYGAGGQAAALAICVALAFLGGGDAPAGPEAPYYRNDPLENWLRGLMMSPFFANAQRIVVRDKLSYAIYEEVHDFLNSGIPLEVRNERLARLNRVLDQLPAGASRNDVDKALAAEMRSWEPSAHASTPLQQP
jgi:hypothetical protein